MAITDIPSALAQYNANLGWYNTAPGPGSASDLALQAINYLIVNQPQSYNLGNGQTITKNLQQLETEKAKIEAFVGVSPRAFGRSRRVGVDYGVYGNVGVG